MLGAGMNWARILAYVTGTVDQELLLRNEYLAAENRILRAQLKGRLKLSVAVPKIVANATPRGYAGREQLPDFSTVSIF
jgi:putative transposase